MITEITNILILISCVLIWIDTDIFIHWRVKKKLMYFGTPLKTFKDYLIKLINCNYCLTFWGSVVLSIVFLNPVYLIATLVLRLINKVI